MKSPVIEPIVLPVPKLVIGRDVLPIKLPEILSTVPMFFIRTWPPVLPIKSAFILWITDDAVELFIAPLLEFAFICIKSPVIEFIVPAFAIAVPPVLINDVFKSPKVPVLFIYPLFRKSAVILYPALEVLVIEFETLNHSPFTSPSRLEIAAWAGFDAYGFV